MKNSAYLASAAALISLSLAGCDKKTDPMAGSRTTPLPATTPAAPIPTTSPASNPGITPATTMPVKTPMDQSEASADVRITADIRRAIMNDSAMSTNAQNCKIITEKTGLVTLRGMVDSQGEKDSVEAKAKAVAGVSRVDNQLEIKVK
ncbi:BON domain-containing protein [Synechococcus sp. Cruz CV-v-12]|uniref:BON domain-containing protein n=1 Tax=Synechococcus sp. Cruz CV-v-12 TaxID=2823728 RepID=UPI0020CC3013|nr:BON domain-containing protein [Synechococcus sp. Cruz CV-v-12]MCP9874393.1 BON domain-containing protein [Synechococcus sp. Cruz CV-v-12]